MQNEQFWVEILKILWILVIWLLVNGILSPADIVVIPRDRPLLSCRRCIQRNSDGTLQMPRKSCSSDSSEYTLESTAESSLMLARAMPETSHVLDGLFYNISPAKMVNLGMACYFSDTIQDRSRPEPIVGGLKGGE